MAAARNLVSSFLGGALLLVCLPNPSAFAYEAVTTLAGLSQQAALSSRLHRILMQRFAYPLGIFEPMRLDLGTLPEARAHRLYARLVSLDPAEGYAPEWQSVTGQVYPLGRQHVAGWLSAGTVLENIPAARMRNHFLDPRTGLGLRLDEGHTSLDNSLRSVEHGVSSFRQFLAGAAFDGTGRSAIDWVEAPESENEMGAQAFRHAYERAIFAELPAQRESALVEGLLAVGGMLGVLGQMGDPAYLHSNLDAALDGRGEELVAERYGRAGVPAPQGSWAAPPKHLHDLFRDGEGGGLSEHTAQRCAAPQRCYTSQSGDLLAEVGRYQQRLLDFLFRGELHMALRDAGQTVEITVVDLPLGSGSVLLLGEQPEGRRRVLQQAEVVPTLTGATLARFSLSAEERKDLHRLVVFYRGRDRANEPLITSTQIVLPRAVEPATPLVE